MADTKSKYSCKHDTACLFLKVGIACYEKKCYTPATAAAVGETCSFTKPCGAGLSCANGGKCRKPEGAECAATSECTQGLPCINGRCNRSNTNEKCNNHSDCVHGLFCSGKHKVCKAVQNRGSLCDEPSQCGKYKCYQGKCQSDSFDTTCAKEGAECPGYLICADGKCRYRLPTGSPCQYSGECEYGLCTNGFCIVAKQNSGCTNDVDCSSGQICGPKYKCCKSGSDSCKY